MSPRDKAEMPSLLPRLLDESGEGKYLYCVAEAGVRASLGKIGIEGAEVSTIPYKDLCAVVHDCLPRPYDSREPEVVEAWVMAHHRVTEAAWAKWGAVLPLSFNTIIKGSGEGEAERNLEHWLEQEHEALRRKMEKVRGKVEYGLQVFWDLEAVARKVAEASPEIKGMEREIRATPTSSGLAYMYRLKLENLLKRQMEAMADERFKDFYGRLRKHVEDVRVEKVKAGGQGWQMLMNLSYLVCRDRSRGLEEELDKICRMEGFSVRGTGPWPPYSFVGA